MPRDVEQSIARVRQAFDVWNAEGLETVARDFWHPDMELVVPPGWEVLLGTDRAVGRDEVVAVYRNAMAAIQDSKVEVDDIEPVGDELLCRVRFRGRGQSSGVDVESVQMFPVVRVEDGRMRRLRWFIDEAAAREAAAAP